MYITKEMELSAQRIKKIIYAFSNLNERTEYICFCMVLVFLFALKVRCAYLEYAVLLLTNLASLWEGFRIRGEKK